MKKYEKSAELTGRKLTLSTGHIAAQADGAVIATYGETVVMATVVAQAMKNDLGYFPLMVEYQEKLYAGGKIKGSRWVKREGRPRDEEILTARLIDRSIRPLFPKGYKKEVQVILTVLSVDLENSPQFVAGVAASAALAISPIPWGGPVSLVNVGLKNGKAIVNPTDADLDGSDLDLFVTSTPDAVVMIEAFANQVDEKQMFSAIKKAVDEAAKIIGLIDSLVKVAGVKKEVFKVEKPKASVEAKVKKLTSEKLSELVIKMATKEAGYSDFDQLKEAVKDEFTDEEKGMVDGVFEDLFKDVVRKMILSGKRPDGRKPDQLRALSASVSFLPRTHGSAIFNRGQTQALSIATLGAPSLNLLIETPEGEEKKRYIHHYTMPPYSTGETLFLRGPKRREIGHGALAEKALLPIIPSEEDFPYTIRVVTEMLSSNGSTSMASVCGSTLSLMDAGVPIKAPVAGIAMGLVIDDTNPSSRKDLGDKLKGQGKYKVLTDIVGVEDGNGDMDFKVAGTKNGITALQLDVKTLKLSVSILEDALKQAKKARLEILKVMLSVLDKPRENVSKHAPKIKVINIPTDKIGELIGPGGKIIKGLSARTNTQIDVDDDGSVLVAAPDEEGLQAALAEVENITKDAVVGEIYDGEVKRIQPFGAFVEVLPGKDGLVHISDMSTEYVNDPNDVVSIGDKVKVRVAEIDNMGRINLTMVLDGSKDKKKSSFRGDRNDRNKRNFRDNKGQRRNNPRRFNRNQRGQRRGGGGGGPHFPATRLLDEKGKKSFAR